MSVALRTGPGRKTKFCQWRAGEGTEGKREVESGQVVLDGVCVASVGAGLVLPSATVHGIRQTLEGLFSAVSKPSIHLNERAVCIEEEMGKKAYIHLKARAVCIKKD